MNQDLQDTLLLLGQKDLDILRLERQVVYLQGELEKQKEKAEKN